MQSVYLEFLSYLERGDKEKCVEMSLEYIEEGKLSISELYNDVLAPALNSISSENEAQKIGIWEEHFRSHVVKTIVECCYPYVIKERDKKGIKKSGQKVVVICPEGEYHDLGARMAADYYTLAGYDSIFIGGSTPREEFIKIIEALKPGYIAISIIGYYNLVAAKKTITSIREKFGNNIKILAGGHALARNPAVLADIGADALVNTYSDILNLGKEDK